MSNTPFEAFRVQRSVFCVIGIEAFSNCNNNLVDQLANPPTERSDSPFVGSTHQSQVLLTASTLACTGYVIEAVTINQPTNQPINLINLSTHSTSHEPFDLPKRFKGN
jgi:hypothetical protein